MAARIARKVGPLFGVVWEQNPFGCTWVCDFGKVTLAEIARGAPYPARDAQSALDDGSTVAEETPDFPGRDGSGTWRRAGRAIWTPHRAPTPALIAHATLNRYGPDTKAAVVLTGANRLLQDVTAAVATVCRHLADQDASPEIRLAVWAGLVLEVFRGQPALVAAAVQARAIQRALTTPWGQHLWLSALAESARCEFGADADGADAIPAQFPGPDEELPQMPTRFGLVDATLPLLGLPIAVSDGPLLSRAEVLDDIATRWCHRLLQIGHPGRGITWVSETAPGHRSVQSYVRIGSVIAPFVAEVFAALSIQEKPGTRVCPEQVSGLLTGVELGRLTQLARRSHLASAHVLANYLRFHDDLLRTQPELRIATRELCDGAADAAVQCLGPDDPVTLLLGGYAAYCRAWDLSRTAGQDPAGAAAAATDLAKQLDRLTGAWRAGVLDQGTASYLLEIGAIALERLRAPAEDLAVLWRNSMLARGVDPDTDLHDPLALPAAHRYHFQNYAAFLAAASASPAGLRRALAAQEACVEVREQVTRGELATYSAKFTSARTSRQAAAAIAGRLALAGEPGQADGTEHRDLLARGVGHARAAMTNPTTGALLAGGGADPELVRLALAVLPVVVAAWELQSGDGADGLVDGALMADADRLLRAASDSAAAMSGTLPEADLAALTGLRRRLGAPILEAGRQLAEHASARASAGKRPGEPHLPALKKPAVERRLVIEVHPLPLAHVLRGDLVLADGLAKLGRQPVAVVGAARPVQHLRGVGGLGVKTAPVVDEIAQPVTDHRWLLMGREAGRGSDSR